MVWSFSRLSSFNTCKMMWYLTYIRNCERRENFFSQYGTFSHEIFEKYNKGELELFDIPDFICYNYDKSITIQAPPNNYVDLGEKYRYRLMEYFSNFNGWKDKTVGTEKEVEFTLNLYNKDRKFTGFIDRLSMTGRAFMGLDIWKGLSFQTSVGGSFYGAIDNKYRSSELPLLGKAYYENKIDLKEALRICTI